MAHGGTAADYGTAVAWPDRIARVNALFDAGHYVVYWTARGTESGVDWRDVTVAQLRRWGARYHRLLMGKPAFDLFIDDKAWQAEEWFRAPSRLL